MNIYENPDWLALMAGIIADPDNDLRRLVVADWLEEQGEEKRAEFIRSQCDADTVESSREVDLGHANRLDWFDAGAGTRLRILNESPWESWPTATGGDWPEFRVRRGFVAELHAAGAWVWGGACDRCSGRGWVARVWRDDGTSDEDRCPVCKGTGRTPAHGYEVIRSHPVTKVVVTDARPHCGRDSWFYWLETGHGFIDGTDALPHDVFSHMDAMHNIAMGVMNGFATIESAHAALSAAVIDAARSTTSQQEATR